MKKTLVAGAAMLGLAGLLGGCIDDNKAYVAEGCTNGSIEFKVVYHRQRMDPDYLSVDVYSGANRLSSLALAREGDKREQIFIECDDGSSLRITSPVFGPGEVYRLSPDKGIEE